MKVINMCLLVVLGGGVLISPRGVALEGNEAAHVHGLAELTLIRDGNDVDVEFISPTVNLLGFERQPETTSERKHAMQVAELLTNPSKLFEFEGGNCSLVKIQPQIPFTSAMAQAVETPEQHHDHASHDGHEDHEDHEDHDDHASHESHKNHDDHASHDGHEDHDDHASHQGHNHQTESSKENHSAHTNAVLNYQFSCVDGAKVKSMSVTMFSQFPNLEAVDLMFVNGNTQGAARLTASDNKVQL